MPGTNTLAYYVNYGRKKSYNTGHQVIAPIIASPKLEFIYSMVFMCCGAAIYVPFVHYRMKLPYMGMTQPTACTAGKL